MPAERILVLAGTTEARELANALLAQGRDVISSFAGVTSAPLLPRGAIHTGGFGGTEGLISFLGAERITCIVDATHPFAAQMSAHAYEAASALGLRLVRLERPAWQPQKGDRWIDVSSLLQAAARIPSGARVLLTTGRKSLSPFFGRKDLSGLVRTIEAPDESLPAQWQLLQDRPPHALADELALLHREAITCLVSKNAGGASTAAKLEAARELALPVIMVRRPSKPACTTFSTVTQGLLGITGDAG